MIRARREEDLDRLCAILTTLNHPTSFSSGGSVREWLTGHAAEESWVFDMAPVRVAPTKNVVGHVQIYRRDDDPAADRLLTIGRLFVAPSDYQQGIARYLLKQSAGYVRDRGKLPVLDRHGHGFPSTTFCEKIGFERVPAEDPGVDLMVYTRTEHR